MIKAEKNLLEFIERKIVAIMMAAIAIGGILVRIPLFKFVSGDMSGYLIVWYDTIKAYGEDINNNLWYGKRVLSNRAAPFSIVLRRGLFKLYMNGTGSGGNIKLLVAFTAAFEIAGTGSGGSNDGEVTFFALYGTSDTAGV